ncbi:MAG: XRE family transcriptional regulator [Anaerolineae bacterium]|nr:XRE family transcriptional regulator [Phycisphaerae bacterium]
MSYTSSKSAHKKRRVSTSKQRAGGSGRSNANVRDDDRITESSGNVFLDIGFPSVEARTLQMRSDLMISIRRIVERRKMTQHSAAKLFGVSQPRMSDLIRGKIERFSIDTLIEMLERAGMTVEILVRAA